MKGSWFPTKALGIGKVSTSPLSSSMSSKLLLSISLLSSGTTGAAARERGKKMHFTPRFSHLLYTGISLVLKDCTISCPQITWS